MRLDGLPDTSVTEQVELHRILFSHVAQYEAFRAELMRRAKNGDEKAKHILWVRWKMRFVD